MTGPQTFAPELLQSFMVMLPEIQKCKERFADSMELESTRFKLEG